MAWYEALDEAAFYGPKIDFMIESAIGSEFAISTNQLDFLATETFDLKGLLTGAGILGLAVGFGAQTLVRDVISGFFLILEDQVRVGDVAVVNGTGGLVEAINLRTIVLRDYDVPPVRRAGGLVSRRAIARKAARLIERFAVKTPSASAPSGGAPVALYCTAERARGGGVLWTRAGVFVLRAGGVVALLATVARPGRRR